MFSSRLNIPRTFNLIRRFYTVEGKNLNFNEQSVFKGKFLEAKLTNYKKGEQIKKWEYVQRTTR